MGQILGQTQDLKINLTNSGNQADFLTLVCIRNFSVNNELATTSEETNCGTKTSVGNAAVTVDFDAICETSPTTTQISYDDLLQALHSKTLVAVEVSSASYSHVFAAYVTSLSLAQEAGAYISFTGTLTSDGMINV
jgi:hypothetical protein